MTTNRVVTLGDLAGGAGNGSIQTGPFGSQLHASDYVPDGVPIVNPTHIERGRIRHSLIPRVSPKDAVRLGRHILRVGDILFSRRGDVGRHAYVSQDEDGWLCGTGCLLVRPNEDEVDSRYLNYWLSRRPAQEFLQQHAVGSIMPNINTQILASVPVELPDRKDQERIAKVLSMLEDAVDLSEQGVAAVGNLLAASLDRLYREGLRGESLKQTQIGEIPQSWDIVALPQVADLFSGGTPSKARSEYWIGSVPWVSPKDMKDWRLSDTMDHISLEAAEDGSRIAPANSVMIVVRGMILIRDVPIAIIERSMAFNQDMKAVVPRVGIEPEFLLCAIMSRKQTLFAEVGTAAHGTRRLGTTSLERLVVPWPKHERERREIGHILRKLYDQQKIAMGRAERLNELFNASLNSLMAGRVRVPFDSCT